MNQESGIKIGKFYLILSSKMGKKHEMKVILVKRLFLVVYLPIESMVVGCYQVVDTFYIEELKNSSDSRILQELSS